eukprot:gb/GFBE01047986.1/.p1 GENE.gb/GFBE01047986.1/~~gb/GFBE01047986.1/.p1  ORF type:complete len:346 (+),score=55.98 gb/GFBE01047986.1/:1-1038(+)
MDTSLFYSKNVKLEGDLLTGELEAPAHKESYFAGFTVSNQNAFVIEFSPTRSALLDDSRSANGCQDWLKIGLVPGYLLTAGVSTNDCGFFLKFRRPKGDSRFAVSSTDTPHKYNELVYSTGPVKLVFNRDLMILKYETDDDWHNMCIQSLSGNTEVGDVVPFITSNYAFELRVRELTCKSSQSSCLAKAMHGQRLFADAIVRAGGEELAVHRAVLAAASPVFKRMLETGFREGVEATVRLETSAKTARALVDHCYCQDLPEKADATALFELAVMYDIQSLQEACLTIFKDEDSPGKLVEGLRCMKRMKQDPQAQRAHKRLRRIWDQRYLKSDNVGREAMLDATDL